MTSLDSSVKRTNKFDIQYLGGEEGIREDFSYRLKISTLERLSDKEIHELIGGSLTVKIGFKDQKGVSRYRFINGIVYQLTELGMSRAPLTPEIWRYEVQLSSWMKKLEYVRDCRIFQKNGNTSMSIISDLLRELGFHDFKNEAGGDFPRRDYEVIYNETVSNFVRRLLQEDGVIWRFEHSENKHLLIFSLDSTALPEIEATSFGQLDAVKSFCEYTRHLPIKECA
ncbi:hypothetical protein KKA14_03430, partial [bacterium]|nr:hypothetical protein [bacterium]